MNELANWLEKKFLEWQLRQGKRISLDEFAGYLGFTRAYISMILNGSRKNLTMSAAYQIGERLNDFSILELLGYPVPDAPLVGFSDEERSVILGLLENVKTQLEAVPAAEREAKLKEIVEAAGFVVSDSD